MTDRADLLRFLVSALLAIVTLVVILFAIQKVTRPGEMLIIRQLDLLVPSESRDAGADEPAREREAPVRPVPARDDAS